MFPIHEYTVDRAKGVARIGRTNPARTFVRGFTNDEGVFDVETTTVQVKDGEIYYFDQGGTALSKDQVPEYVLIALRDNPVRKGHEKVEQVIKFCSYCPAPDNAIGSEAYEAHLVKHLVAAGIAPVSKEPAPPAKVATKRKG